jgi:arginine:ornithine antiporter/lysine permease
MSYLSLVLIIISAMIGAGLYSLPQNMAYYTGAQGTIVAWLITCSGIMALIAVFKILAEDDSAPPQNNVLFDKITATLGKFIGFNATWGYWLCQVLANVSYALLIFTVLGYFFDTEHYVIFGEGNTLISLLGSSIFIWVIYFIALGSQQHIVKLNDVITLVKIIPLLGFIIFCVY